jgi:predicted nucleic acid-binding protein
VNGAKAVPDVVVVDTDVLIDAGRAVKEAMSCLQQIEQQASLAISVISQMELIVGCRSKDEFRSLEKFLLRFQILKLNPQASDTAIDLQTMSQLHP